MLVWVRAPESGGNIGDFAVGRCGGGTDKTVGAWILANWTAIISAGIGGVCGVRGISMSWPVGYWILLVAAMLQSAGPARPGAVEGAGDELRLSLGLRSARLQSLVLDENVERDEVRKRLMNSDVSGQQTTQTQTRVRIIPGTCPLKFELETVGEVSSETTGLNAQAAVNSSGQHRFEVLKPLWFDGSLFRTQKGYGTIQAWQWPQRVTSRVGQRSPALAPLSDRLAWNQVLLLQPRINRAVAQDLSRDVLPKIDEQVERRFAQLQERWRLLQAEPERWLPDRRISWSACATESEVQIAARATESGSAEPVLVLPEAGSLLREQEDVVLLVSESVLGRAANAALEQALAAWGGRIVPDTRLEELRQRMRRLQGAGSEVEGTAVAGAAAAAATLYSLEFAEGEALRVQCVDGVLRVLLRVRVVPRAGAPSDWLQVRLDLRGEVRGAGVWRVLVSAVEVSGGTEGWLALVGGVVRGLEGQQVGGEQPREYALEWLPGGRLYLRQVESAGGRLRLSGVLQQQQ